MPRYFFDVEDHHTEVDDIGQELSGPAEARVHAIVYAGSILRDEPDMVWDGEEFSVRVSDEDRNEVVSVYVRAVDATPGGDAS